MKLGAMSKDEANRRVQELEKQLEEVKEAAQTHLAAVLAEVAEELDAERLERKQLQEAHDALLEGREPAPREPADDGSLAELQQSYDAATEARAQAEARVAEIEESLQASA